MLTVLRAILVDDHKATLEGLKLMLTRLGLSVVGTNATGQNLELDVETLKPDVVFLDLALGPQDGITLAARLKRAFPLVKIIGFSFRQDVASVRDFLATGAEAYLLKTAEEDEIKLALETVFRGKPFLSPQLSGVLLPDSLHLVQGKTPAPALTAQETTIVRLLGAGKTSKEIGLALDLSPRSVEKYRATLLEKLQLTTLADPLKWGIKAGVIVLD